MLQDRHEFARRLREGKEFFSFMAKRKEAVAVAMTESAARYLVVVADDFGRSASINRAVALAHEQGVLTAASIMAGGKAVQEALLIARRHPIPFRGAAPDAVRRQGRSCARRRFPAWSTAAAISNAARPGPGSAITAAACCPSWSGRSRRSSTGLSQAGITPTHVDGHHHLHLHPAVFPMVCRIAAGRGVRWVRIPARTLRRRDRARRARPAPYPRVDRVRPAAAVPPEAGRVRGAPRRGPDLWAFAHGQAGRSGIC